jgi:hypothetical protein
MERTQIFDLMGELKLYGMKAAFDEIMATASSASTNLNALSATCSTPRSTRSRPGRSNTSSPLPSCRLPRTSPTSSSTARRSINDDVAQVFTSPGVAATLPPTCDQ